jgi:hypothetical protein
MTFLMTFNDRTFGRDYVSPVSRTSIGGSQPFPIPRVGETVIAKDGRRREVKEVEYLLNENSIVVTIQTGDFDE